MKNDFDEIQGLISKAMALTNQKVNEIFNAPLKNGLMNDEQHAEFKADIDKYGALLFQGRTVEAESLQKKLMEKYEKLDKENGI